MRDRTRDGICGEPVSARAGSGGLEPGDRGVVAQAQRRERARVAVAVHERGRRDGDPAQVARHAVRGRAPRAARRQDRPVTDRRASLAEVDPQIHALIKREVERQEHGLELIASENFVSVAVLEAMGTALTNKYAEGVPKKRYYGGCEVVDEVEQLAIDRAKQIFGAEHANVQPHSGAQANMAAYLAVLKAGETLMGLALPHGGHLTHGASVNFSGSIFRSVQYGVREDTGRIDYDQVSDLARKEHPKLLIAGRSEERRVGKEDRSRWSTHQEQEMHISTAAAD